MKIEPSQGVRLTKIYNHLKEFVSWRYKYLKEFVSWRHSHLKEFVSRSSTQAFELGISRTSSHGARHIKEFVSWISAQDFKLDIN